MGGGKYIKKTGQLKKSAVCPRILRDENQLTANDWSVLQHFATILGHYEDAVKTLEGDGLIRKRKRGYTGSYGNIWDVLNGFEFLLGKLEKLRKWQRNFLTPNNSRLVLIWPGETREVLYYSRPNADILYCCRTPSGV